MYRIVLSCHGIPLAAELSDAVVACVAGEFDSRITIDSVTVVAQR